VRCALIITSPVCIVLSRVLSKAGCQFSLAQRASEASERSEFVVSKVLFSEAFCPSVSSSRTLSFEKTTQRIVTSDGSLDRALKNKNPFFYFFEFRFSRRKKNGTKTFEKFFFDFPNKCGMDG
jgi:hypothetical protein